MSVCPGHCCDPGGQAQHWAHKRGSDVCLMEAQKEVNTTSSQQASPLGLGDTIGVKALTAMEMAGEGIWGMVPELRMVGRALGGRDPVRELVLLWPLWPLLLVPPPLHVSCREESWPGMEMDLAVDGGLGRTDRGVTGVPHPWGQRQGRPEPGRVPEPPPPQCPGWGALRCPPQAARSSTHVLKQGSPESRNIPMVTCVKGGEISQAISTPSPGTRPPCSCPALASDRLGLWSCL